MSIHILQLKKAMEIWTTKPQHLEIAGKANAPQTNKQASQLNQ